MDVHFSCPHCEQMLAVDSSGAGETIFCPSCNREILIPLDSEKVGEHDLGQLPHNRRRTTGEWTKDPISPKQTAMLVLYGIEPVEGMTKGEASELISEAKDSGVRPTQAQERAAAKLFAFAEMQHAIKIMERTIELLGTDNCTIKSLKFAKKQITAIPQKIEKKCWSGGLALPQGRDEK